jgi:hypothetical protein
MNGFIYTLLFCLTAGTLLTGQAVSTFDEIDLGMDSIYNGIDGTLGQTDGDAFFPTFYDTSFGGFWAAGWAISAKTDSVTSGFTNLYSAKAGSGALGTPQYAVGQQNAVIRLQGEALENPLRGLYITNSTYAHNSMRDGDQFAKPFGGPTGDDPDFFKLVIRAFANGQLQADSVEFFLADYRFADNSQDFIRSDWTYVDLSPLGTADSLLFTLTSSDVGDFGMNTPPFFCIDQFNSDEVTSITGVIRALPLRVGPNPASQWLNVQLPEEGRLSLLDAAGRVYWVRDQGPGRLELNIAELPVGWYVLRYQTDGDIYHTKWIKQ